VPFFYVGMNQAVVMPKNCAAYDGITTAGLDSCTGVALSSATHIFLAHYGPPPLNDEPGWKRAFTHSVTEAVNRMGGAFAAAWVATPNFGDFDTPNFGPAFAEEELNEMCDARFAIPVLKQNHLTILSDGAVTEDAGRPESVTTSTVQFMGGMKLNTIDGIKILTFIN
jgi:hypothetical protein